MQQKKQFNQSEKGISIVEILVVVVIIGILTAITAMSLFAPKKYNAENQALILIDLMREAQQRALSQKRTMRVEINSTDRTISLINENEPTDADNDGVSDTPTASNDEILKTLKYNSDNVYVGIIPTNMTNQPTELSPVTAIPFTNSVAKMRFRSNGTVHDAGNNTVGTNSVATGRTIYVWTKKDGDTSASPTVADILRAVTVLGSSGSTKLWKCAVISNQCTTWTR